MTARTRLVVAALAVLLALGGCTGIPTGGPGREVPADGELDQEAVRYAPAPPTPGASPRTSADAIRAASSTDIRTPPAGPSASPVHGSARRPSRETPTTARGESSASVAGTYAVDSPSGPSTRSRSTSR